MKSLFTILCTLFVTASFSATKLDIEMPDKVTIDGKELVLNGQGVRKATWLKVKVYVGGLYISSKSQDASQVMNQSFPKFIDMTFLRDVGEDKLQGGWSDGFEAAVNSENRKKYAAEFKQFNSTMKEILKKQKILITFTDKGVKVNFNGTESKHIGDAGFAKAIFSIWFVNAKDEDLRDGLLGKI